MGKSKYFLLDCQLFTGDLIEIARNPSLTETGIGFKGKIKGTGSVKGNGKTG